MIDIQNGLDVENIYKLIRKQIHGKYATKSLQINKLENLKDID